MSEQTVDRRVQKTRESIYKAFDELTEEKRYAKITIKDIIDRANVGRATFYAHFETKDDLMFKRAEGYFNLLNEYVILLINQENEDGRLLSIEAMFEHVKEKEKIIRSIFFTENMDVFQNRVKHFWRTELERYLKDHKSKHGSSELPVDVLANHITMTLISLLDMWLNSKTEYSAKQMDTYFQLLINPCLNGYLGH